LGRARAGEGAGAKYFLRYREIQAGTYAGTAGDQPLRRSIGTALEALAPVRSRHRLPPLLYSYAALEPHIDARTMQLHHDLHHAAYVEKLNAGLARHPELQERSALWLLLNASKLPADARTDLCNNAGGHVNHSMFWQGLSPYAGGEPAGALADAIKRDFGGLEKFKAQFEAAGRNAFGAGWVWLARTQQEGGRLVVLTTAGHGNPLVQGYFPLLVNDLWEHAYYLKHENRRPDYLKGWWPVVHWREVARRLESAVDGTPMCAGAQTADGKRPEHP
jgi:superoxide dismutase, Fe-Mn family